jgi:hypothetical protein
LGINRIDLELLIELRRQQHIPLNRHVIEIGAQQLSNSFLRSADLVSEAETAFGAVRPYVLPAPGASTVSAEHVELLDSNAPFARDFWVALGFDYAAIDVDGSPGSIALDLNCDQVPSALQGKYGLVTNLGTTEHVCNQMNAFRVIHDLAAPGAVMIHHLPAGGMLNHGLVNYNPKFFWHLARSNDYKWLHMNFYGSGNSYAIAANILDFVGTFVPQGAEAMRQREISDYAMLVAFQKTLDIPFVAPLDVNTGTRSDNATLNRRYWSVLQPEILETARRSGRPRQLVAQLIDDGAAADAGAAVAAGALPRTTNRRLIALVAIASALGAAIVTACIMLTARLSAF